MLDEQAWSLTLNVSIKSSQKTLGLLGTLAILCKRFLCIFCLPWLLLLIVIVESFFYNLQE